MLARSLLGAGMCLALALASPQQVTGCSSEQPTFAAAVRAASTIARIVVVHEPAYGDADLAERHLVVKALKGPIAGEIRVDDPRATLCGDRVGFFADEGQEAIVAYGVPFFGETLNVTWVATDSIVDPIVGSATVPDGVATLSELEAAIVAALPDTAVEPPGASAPWLAAATACIAGAAVAVRRKIDPRL